MLENKEENEGVIHNLFMKKSTEDDYFMIGKNNLWLLDDRFTSYTYAASDKRIKTIIDKIGLEEGSEIERDRSDISMFFSHEPLNKEGLKAVIIEIKPFKDTGKSDRDKFNGVQQLLDYIEAFKEKEQVKEVWAFLVTDIDTKFAKRLDKNGYVPMFSTERPIYYKNYKAGFIYVIGVETIVADAKARNSMFIDIISRHSRISKYLEDTKLAT
jgi:hypothetical protein